MKKSIVITFLAAAAMLAASCQKEYEAQTVKVGNTTFSVRMAEETKTALASDGHSVNWLATDKISVFDGADGNCMFSALSVNGSTAEFTGDVTVPADSYYALYPYDESATVSGGVISATLPAAQTPVNGGFADGLNMSVAKSDGTTLEFKNVTSLIKFTIPEELGDIVSATFTAAETLAGNFTVDLSGESPVITKGTGSNTVTFSNGGSKIAPGTYYVEVLPGEISGLSITLTTLSGEKAKFSNSTAVALNRSRIRNVGTVKWDYKALYDAGETITICGQSFNKATYGDSKEIIATTADFDIPKNNSIGWADMNTGVIFMSAEDGCNFRNANIRKAGSGKTVVMIGRYKGEPTVIQSSNQIQLNGGTIAMKNITLDRATTDAQFFSMGASSVALLMDECIIKDDVSGNQFAYFGVTDGAVETIDIENCTFDYSIPSSGSNMFINASGCTNLAGYKNIIFKNNVFYNSIRYARITLFGCSQTTQSTASGGETVHLDNNTFYNLCSGYQGYIKQYHLDKFTANKNLLHVNTTGISTYLFSAKSYDANTVEVDSRSFGAYSNSWVINFEIGSSVSENLIPKVYPNATDPLPNVVDAYKDYTPVSAYSTYGAKR